MDTLVQQLSHYVESLINSLIHIAPLVSAVALIWTLVILFRYARDTRKLAEVAEENLEESLRAVVQVWPEVDSKILHVLMKNLSKRPAYFWLDVGLVPVLVLQRSTEQLKPWMKPNMDGLFALCPQENVAPGLIINRNDFEEAAKKYPEFPQSGDGAWYLGLILTVATTKDQPREKRLKYPPMVWEITRYMGENRNRTFEVKERVSDPRILEGVDLTPTTDRR